MAFYRLSAKLTAATGGQTLLHSTGLVKNAPHFRKYLLGLHSYDDFDQERFGRFDITQKRIDTHAMEELQTEMFFAANLAQWSCESRRIYRPSPDLELALLATDLGELTWKEIIPMPFRSYGIQLPTPIKHEPTGREYDFLLINQHSDATGKTEGFIQVTLFSTHLDKWKPYSLQSIERAERNVERGYYEGAIKLVHKLRRSLTDFTPTSVIPISTHIPIAETQSGRPALNQLLRLVAGFNLYLSTLSSQRASEVMSDWHTERTRRGIDDPRAVTNEANVCDVATNFSLSPEEQEAYYRGYILHEPGYEMPAHFRSAHWRRPPRTRQNPEQKKTVWVRSTLVRRDRLGPNELPGGSQVDVE